MILKYFTDANSAAGYVSLQEENLLGISTIYHLKGPEGLLIHHLLEQLSNLLSLQQLKPEFIYSTFNPDFLAGLIIRELDMAFTSGKVVVAGANLIDLTPVYEQSIIRKHQEEIERLTFNAGQFYKKMYMHLNAALHIHDEWEKIYIDRMDFDQADRFREDLVATLFNTKIHASGKARVLRRFFGASTPVGLHDFIPELTAGLKRYLIKGRPGSGKSTLMKDVVAKAEELGYDVDVYHCSLDPKSLDMVVVPELDFCLFDATSPHEYEPSFASDEVVDTYSAFIRKDTDMRCADVLSEIESRYKNQIKSALLAMGDGHDCQLALQQFYESALIPKEVDHLLTLMGEKVDKAIEG